MNMYKKLNLVKLKWNEFPDQIHMFDFLHRYENSSKKNPLIIDPLNVLMHNFVR
jgi:hypothetical protein